MQVDDWSGVGPLPTLYAKTADGAINVWTCWVEGCHVFISWGQLDGQMQTGSYACAPKNTGKANATTPEQQAILEARSRWKKQLKKRYSPDKEIASTGFNLKPMLAKAFNDRRSTIEWPVTVQPKYDGLRCLAYRKDGSVLLQSRGGDPYSVSHIAEELGPFLEDGYMLDGELYVHGASLQTINSLVRRPQPDSLLLEYHVYDGVMLKDTHTPWTTRQTTLAEWFSRIPPVLSIKAVPSWETGDEQGVENLHAYLVQEGFEGVIVRLRHGAYRFGFRSSELLKYKHFQDDEFEIVGFSVGKGKFSNVPIFRCVTKEGKPFDVVTRGTDQERQVLLEQAPSLTGKLLTVRFFNLTDDGIPHFPVGISVRLPEDMDRS